MEGMGREGERSLFLGNWRDYECSLFTVRTIAVIKGHSEKVRDAGTQCSYAIFIVAWCLIDKTT